MNWPAFQSTYLGFLARFFQINPTKLTFTMVGFQRKWTKVCTRVQRPILTCQKLGHSSILQLGLDWIGLPFSIHIWISWSVFPNIILPYIPIPYLILPVIGSHRKWTKVCTRVQWADFNFPVRSLRIVRSGNWGQIKSACLSVYNSGFLGQVFLSYILPKTTLPIIICGFMLIKSITPITD